MISLCGMGTAEAGVINGASIKADTMTGTQITNDSVRATTLEGSLLPTTLPKGATVGGQYHNAVYTSAANRSPLEAISETGP